MGSGGSQESAGFQGAPADGRRLGSSQAVAFDEAAAEVALGARGRMTAPTVVRERA